MPDEYYRLMLTKKQLVALGNLIDFAYSHASVTRTEAARTDPTLYNLFDKLDTLKIKAGIYFKK